MIDSNHKIFLFNDLVFLVLYLTLRREPKISTSVAPKQSVSIHSCEPKVQIVVITVMTVEMSSIPFTQERSFGCPDLT